MDTFEPNLPRSYARRFGGNSRMKAIGRVKVLKTNWVDRVAPSRDA